MKHAFRKIAAVLAITLAVLGAPKKSEAGIGVVSLIGGPAGVPIIVAGAGLALGGSLAVLGTCYIGEKVADWSPDCPIFMNFTFWPGLVLLSADESTGLASDIIAKYGADQESANLISDRIYNKALRAAKKMEKGQQRAEGEALVVKFQVSLSEVELRNLVTPAFTATEGFARLVQDYE